MEIIKNNKGGSKLCAGGYLYTKKSSNTKRIRWECSQRKAFSCKGYARTDLEVKQLLSVSEHSHDPDPNKVRAVKMKNTIKTYALTNRSTPTHIVEDAICKEPLEVRCAIGRLDSLKRNVRRLQKEAFPKDLPSPGDFEHISDKWSTTGAPEYNDFVRFGNKRSLLNPLSEKNANITKHEDLQECQLKKNSVSEWVAVIPIVVSTSMNSQVQDTGSLPTEETSEEFKPVKCKDEEIDPADIYNNVHQDAIALSSVETSEDEIVCKEEEIDVTPAIENMEEEEEEASASASGNVAVPPPRQLPGGGSLDSRQAKEVAPGVCNDEFHHFGMNLAWQLRRMPLRAAIETQLEIQRLLTAKRLEYLD